jgi:HK97 family phage major capsid protein
MAGLPGNRTSPWNIEPNSSPDMQRMVKSAYSLKKIVLGGDSLDMRSWEFAVSQELSRTTGIGANKMGVMVPLEALCQRSDLSATGGTSVGGATVEASLQDTIIPALFPHSIAVRLGARVFPNLRGNFVYPSLSTPSSRAAASGENTAVTVDSTARFSQLLLDPQRLTTEVWVSRQLVTQSEDRQIEKFLSDQILAGLGALLDGLALTGSSAGYAPITGLLNNPGLSTITFGGSMTWAQVQQQIYNVSNLNFPMDGRAWAISPATRQKLSASQKIAASNFPSYIYDSDTNTIAGYPVAETTNLTGNQIIYGRWPELAVCLWGAADILSDPYTYLSQNIIRLVVSIQANAGVMRPGFCVSTDAGNQ